MGRQSRLSAVTLVAATLVAGMLVAVGPASAAVGPRSDRAPLPPTHLTVDDRTDPLGVDGLPAFGWLPRDPDGDETQTAYQLVVRDGRTVVWDSHRTASSTQSWVPYAGPALTDATSYTWQVRTWDRAGLRSPYSPPARFDTGLADSSWSGAEWIRRPTSGNDARNDYTLARRELTVSHSPVVRARAYVSAMGDWELHVDGHTVDRTSSPGYPGEGYYDVSDITRYATPGRPLALGVLYHYWTCTCQGRANGPVAPEGPSGLLVKVVIDHADGTSQTAVSDAAWTVTRDAAESTATVTYRNSDAGDYVEYSDARAELSGWDTAGYDDSGWAAPTVIGPHPRPAAPSCAGYEGGSAPCTFTHLTAQQAHLATERVHPVSVRTLADGTTIADFGKVIPATPAVHLAHGTAGTPVTVTTTYRLNNTVLTSTTPAGASTVTLAGTAGFAPGDRVTVDAPADGYGAGHPESRTVTATSATTLTLDRPLALAHTSPAYVEGSRAGTSKLDTQGSDLRYLYTERDGDQTAQPFTAWGWRYLQVSGAGAALSPSDITAVVEHTEAPHPATFHSDGATLDAVFDLMRRSALYSSQQVFVDTPTREKGQFLGDTVDDSLATMESLGERGLTRQAVLDFVASQARYWTSGANAGRLNAVYPNGDARRDIPDYTEMFPEWVMRYYQLTGDRSLLAAAYPTMRAVADYVSAAVDPNGTGLVYQLPGGGGPYQYGIIDWPPPMRYDTVVTGNGAETVVNALAVGALHSVADAADTLDDTAGAATYRTRGDVLAARMRATLRDPATGHFADGLSTAPGNPVIANQSEHAQTYAIDYGVAPPSDYPSLGAYLTTLGMRQGPMDLRQLTDALRRTGRPDTLLSLLTDPTADGPAKILAENGTYLWEQWNPGCAASPCAGTQVDTSSSESFSHGWGSAGITGILQGLLGLTVTSAGAATLAVTPPAGATRLHHASGTEWTERGPVTVSWSRSRHGMALRISLPTNTTATVTLPASSHYDVSGTGAGANGRAGTHGASGTVVFTVGSGDSTFTPR